MNDWQSTCLGRRSLPRDLSDFEIEAFFTFSEAERRIIEERRRPVLKLALALQIGFVRMSGRLLEAVRIVPPSLWRHLGEQFDVAAPDLASLRSMYHRRRTLFEHQEVACETLGFHWLSNAQRGALVRVVRDELTRTFDRQRLLQFARRWLYDHRLVVLRERELRALILQALRQYEAQFAAQIVSSVGPQQLSAWKAAIVQPHASGSTMQSWLWAAPAKHSTPQIKGVLDRIEVLKCLGVSAQLTSVPDAVLSRYAQRLVSRAPAVAARIAEPARTIEVACFLRYTLLRTTDRLLLMVRRQVADLWSAAAEGIEANLSELAQRYQQLLGEVDTLAGSTDLSGEQVRERLRALMQAHRDQAPRSRAQLVRERLMEAAGSARALLRALVQLPWRADSTQPLLEAMHVLQDRYERDERTLPVECEIPLGRVWRTSLAGEDRGRAFVAAEVGTLLNLRRALRNGTVWIDHSLAFRSRETLFIAPAQWQQSRRAHYRRLSLPGDPAAFLEPLAERAQAGIQAVALAAEARILRIDDQLHLTPLEALEEDPKLTKLRAALDKRVGEAQLPGAHSGRGRPGAFQLDHARA